MTQKQELAEAFAEVKADIKATTATVSESDLMKAAMVLCQLVKGTKDDIIAALASKDHQYVQCIISLAALQLISLSAERTMERLQAEEN